MPNPPLHPLLATIIDLQAYLLKIMSRNYEAPRYVISYIRPFCAICISYRRIIWRNVTSMETVCCLLKCFHFATWSPELKCLPVPSLQTAVQFHSTQTRRAFTLAVVYYWNIWIFIKRTGGGGVKMTAAPSCSLQVWRSHNECLSVRLSVIIKMCM